MATSCRLLARYSEQRYDGRHFPALENSMIELESVRMKFPEDTNIIVGQTHFIKTAEDMYEAVVNTVPQAKFGLACNAASGPCLTRAEGNDDELRNAAIANAQARGVGNGGIPQLIIIALCSGQAWAGGLVERQPKLGLRHGIHHRLVHVLRSLDEVCLTDNDVGVFGKFHPERFKLDHRILQRGKMPAIIALFTVAGEQTTTRGHPDLACGNTARPITRLSDSLAEVLCPAGTPRTHPHPPRRKSSAPSQE